MKISKEIMEEFIYKINGESPFLLQSKIWSSPVVGFSYNKSRSIKFMDALMKANIVKENREDVICILADWETVAEGIFFTDKAMYVNSPKNETKRFSVRYNEIDEIKYYSSLAELKIVSNNREYYVTHPMWSKRDINIFLQFATGFSEFDETDKKRIENIKIENAENKDVASVISGIIYGDVSNASTLYGMDKFNTPRGHGFAAEHANHLHDKIRNVDFFGQNKVKMVGEEIDPATGRIVKDGADRIVNGVNIQTKYCRSGSACIAECFEDNKFRYFNSDGTPMQIEVPSDMYDSAIQAMENRISRGEVPGITDPKEAKNIIRKGNYTYNQARNIAKAGNIDSIKFDATNGAIVATSAFGISAAISFATSIWNGEDAKVALKTATHTGLKVGGTTFITAVLSGQLSKAGLNSALVGSSEAIVQIMGPKASAALVNAFRSGNNIYGAAAMKSAAKMLRGNVITGGVTVVVLSSADVVNIFRGRISGKQLFKNITNTTSTVAGGTAGWVGGAAAGAKVGAVVGSIFPGAGTAIGGAIGGTVGGLIGSVAGGTVSGKISDTVLGTFIEDDADEMVRIIEKVFTQLAEDYLLNQNEVENILGNLSEKLNGKTLKDMFESDNRRSFAKNLLIDEIKKEVAKRQTIVMPSEEKMQMSLREVLEEISDEMEKSQKQSAAMNMI